MPKPRTREHWASPTYTVGFVYNRGGVAYINIADKIIRSTRLKFIPANKKRALDILDQAVGEYLNPPEQQNKHVQHTIYSLIKEYGEIYFPNMSHFNIRNIKQSIGHFIKQDYPLFQIDDIRKHIIENSKLCGLSANTKRRNLQRLKQIFNYAIDEGYIGRNPITKAMLPKEEKPKLMVFTRGETESLINYFHEKNYEFSLLIQFISITGVRIQEALKIMWQDVSDTFILIRGKGTKNRYFPLEPFPELVVLLKQIKELNNKKLFRWNTYAKLEKWLRDACKKLEIYEEGKSFHSIRKMRENELIKELRFDLDVTAELMGHTRKIQEAHYLEVLGPEKTAEIIMKRKML
ncbi:MAG: tyrosine-type recombinase/integrase [Cyclobacteriaceae bacterium]